MKRKLYFACVLLILMMIVVSAFACLPQKETKNPGKVTVLDDRFDLTNKVLNFMEELYYDDVDYDLADLYAAYGLVSSLGKYNYINSVEDLLSSASDGMGFGLIVRNTVYNEHLIDMILDGSPFLTPSDGRSAQRGDEIYAIEGIRLSGVDSSTYSAYISQLPSDKAVTFTLKRDGETFDVSYQKVAFQFLTCIYFNDLPGVDAEFGYICLRSFEFTKTIEQEFQMAIRSFNEDGNRALILDLRGNGGGNASVFAMVASALIGENTTVGEKLLEIHYAKLNYTSPVYSVAAAHKITTPIYVLCDGRTASASEALIGTMKVHGTLTALIGQNTVGKGVAQNGMNVNIEDSLGYFKDYALDENGDITEFGEYLVQLIVGKYFIIDPSAEGGKYCIHENPFVPDIKITGDNVVSPDYSEDLYIAAAMNHYSENKNS